MKKLALALLLLLVPLLAIADEELIGIGGTYWTRQYSEDTTASCVTDQNGSSTCMLIAAGDDRDLKTNFHPLRRVISVTMGGAGRCCYSGDPALDLSGTELVDSATDPGACPFVFETANGGRYDDRPNRLFMIAAGTNGMRTGLCSVAVTNSGDSLFAPCDADADCNSPYGGGTCTALANTTAEQRARASVFLICDSDSGSVLNTVRKQYVTK